MKQVVSLTPTNLTRAGLPQCDFSDWQILSPKFLTILVINSYKITALLLIAQGDRRGSCFRGRTSKVHEGICAMSQRTCPLWHKRLKDEVIGGQSGDCTPCNE
jgi:hypothetical protein